MSGAWLDARWPAPPAVRAFTTLRHGLGVSPPPFDHFNLGLRAGEVQQRAGPLDDRERALERVARLLPPALARRVEARAEEVARLVHLGARLRVRAAGRTGERHAGEDDEGEEGPHRASHSIAQRYMPSGD